MRFEKHDGMLFRMLDEPVPLTPDAKMPCLVRLIQDDSPMGKYNQDMYKSALHTIVMCIRINSQNDINTSIANISGSSLHYARYEIIGTLVEEGSAEWALQMMKLGKCVCHVKAPSIKYHRPTHYVKRVVRENCTDDMSDAVWMEGADTTGWQLYEPAPQYNVGDWVEFIDVGGRTSQGKYLSKAYDHAILVRDITYNMRCVVPTTKITRKLSPSEVIVKIGCLSGTIGKSCESACFLMWHSNPKMDFDYSIIRFSALDTQTREIVEGLIDAQKEDG
jgi:hypothetical protein